MTVQIEITVVCHINYRILIRYSFIMNRQPIFLVQRIGNFHVQRSRISLISIRAVQKKGYMVIPVFDDPPHPFLIDIRSAVQIIFPVILCQLIINPVNRHTRTTDPVCISSDNCPDRCRSIFITGCILIPKYHFYRIFILIQNGHIHKGRSKVRDLHFHPCVIFHFIKIRFTAVFRYPEFLNLKFFHFILSSPIFFV